MQLFTFVASLLAFAASSNAFMYKDVVEKTTEYNIEKFLFVQERNITKFNGHNIQLNPSGPKPTDFNAGIDNSSVVLIYTLFQGNVFSQMVGRRGFKPTRVHAGLRDKNPVDGGNTTVREVYFSKDTEQGDGVFALLYITGSPGLYQLAHSVVIPQGVKVVTSGFALCPRAGMTFYQLVFLVSNGRKLFIPKACTGVGVGTVLAPTVGQLKKNSSMASNPSFGKIDMSDAPFTITHYA